MTIYRIHVSLLDTQPTIWRRIELSSQTTLKQFHNLLQIVMGWEDYHMHAFEAGKVRYGVPSGELHPSDVILPEGKFTLADVLPRKGSKLLYTYDFGDDWNHLIKLEAILPASLDIAYPRVLDGARNCPPEDCGGPFGYADLLDILSNPEDENHQEMREWAGAGFDPEAFSPEDRNRRLRRKRSAASKS